MTARDFWVVFVLGAKGWGSSNRRERLPSDWASRRLVVLRRDDFKCQWRYGSEVCGVRATDVDHVVAGDDHSFGNLRSLCREHHARKSAGEGAAAYWAGVRASRSKFAGRGGKHPGVL